MVLDWKSSQEYPVNHDICNIAIYAGDTTLYSKYDQASDLWQQLELASELKSDLETLWTMAGSGMLISMVEKLN